MAQILSNRLFGFVGLGPADRRFISRMHFRDLLQRTVPAWYAHWTKKLQKQDVSP